METGDNLSPFAGRVIRLIQEIPPGKVATYGQIAFMAGSPRGALQVARILNSVYFIVRAFSLSFILL
jgi:methylated-DNA-protein-cysteine methyltransferase-like protein